MPHNVPNRPMNGATEPVVARIARPLCRRVVTLLTERWSEAEILGLERGRRRAYLSLLYDELRRE